MTFILFLKLIVTSHSGVSSKRVCGLLGWLICLLVLIYCTIAGVLAPEMIDTVLYGCMGLLGIDSVTGIFKNNKHENNKLDNK